MPRLDRRFVRPDRRFRRLPKRLVLLNAANCGIFLDLTGPGLSRSERVARWPRSVGVVVHPQGESRP